MAAPACRAECSIGASRFESGDTHHEGPVVQLAEATGSKSAKSGFESQRGPQLALRAPTTACYCERPESAPDEICAHSIPKRFKYLRRRSASFVVALRPRDALNNSRPASESVLHCRHTSMT